MTKWIDEELSDRKAILQRAVHPKDIRAGDSDGAMIYRCQCDFT